MTARFLSARWWADLPIARKLDLYVTLVLVLVLIMALLTSLTVAELNRTSGQRIRAQTRLTDINSLKEAMLNIETGQRGYVLSGRENFLEPYRRGRQAVAELLPKLERDPEAPAAMRPLAASIRTYLSQWAEPSIARIRTGRRFSERDQLALFEEGKRSFDALREQFAAVEGDMAGQFAQSRDRNLRGIGQLSRLVWMAIGLLLLFALLTRWAVRQTVVQPVQRLREATTRLGVGDYAARAPVSSSDELGQLAHAFNLAAANLQEADAKLREQQEELRRSNRELEQFAYVASHDLQEPLRMVSSYTQLLERRYKGKLDEKADVYIHFAVDGANRMQRLIQDLLVYSRVGTKAVPPERVETGKVVAEVLQNLEIALQESEARVEVGELPAVWADPSQVAQVFQNLIANAIKFRREGVKPQVEINARKDGDFWEFQVRDNGIGIEEPYFDRIFLIFQRLHTKEAYPGSGIGLAVVKKIIERHGGRLWLQSVPEQGSSFFFTLPEAPNA